MCGQEEILKSQCPVYFLYQATTRVLLEEVFAAPCENQIEEAREGRSGYQVLTQCDAAGAHAHTQVDTHIALAVAGAIDNDDGAKTCARGDDHQCRRQPLFTYLYFRLKAAGPAPLGIQNGQEPNRRTHGTSGSPPAHVRRPMAPGSLRAHQQHPSHCPSLPSCTSHNPRAGLPYLEHPLTREKARSGSAAAAQRQLVCTVRKHNCLPFPPHREPPIVSGDHCAFWHFYELRTLLRANTETSDSTLKERVKVCAQRDKRAPCPRDGYVGVFPAVAMHAACVPAGSFVWHPLPLPVAAGRPSIPCAARFS